MRNSSKPSLRFLFPFFITFFCFSLIDISVLSVIAQQIRQINDAKTKQIAKFYFEGSELELNPGYCIVAILSHSGGQHCKALPVNLKAHFRSFAMVTPDTLQITRTIMQAYGMENVDVLSSKLVQAFQMLENTVSQKKHYIFKLSDIKRCIDWASDQSTAMQMDHAIAQAFNHVCAPKMVSHDKYIVGMVIDKIFSVPLQVDQHFYDIVTSVTKDFHYEASHEFVQRVCQLQHLINMTTGLILVGKTMTGKSTLLKVLAATLVHPDIENMQTRVVSVNPRSMNLSQLFGRFDPATKEWIDGVLVRTVRENSKDSAERKWIVFDGPVDPQWTDSLGTMLDSSKKLCLFTGEIVALGDRQSIIFECDSLCNASPSMITRCGLMTVSECHDFYLHLIKTWATKRHLRIEHTEALVKLAKWILPPLFDYLNNANISFIHRCPKLHLLENTLKLLDSLLDGGSVDDSEEDYDEMSKGPATVDVQSSEMSEQEFTRYLAEEKEKQKDNEYQQIINQFIFSSIWSIGGLLDSQSRLKFDELFRDLTSGQNPSYPRPTGFPLPRHFQVPRNGRVFDFYFSNQQQGESDWVMFSTKLLEQTVESGGKIYAFQYVPTVETIKQCYLIGSLLKFNIPVVVSGERGTGKTTLMNEIFHKLEKNGRNCPSISLQVKTSSQQLQDIIISKMKRKEKGFYQSPGQKHLVLFIEDLAMPEHDCFGVQGSSELLRQLIESNFTFDSKDGSRIHVEGINICSSLVPSPPGCKQVSERLLRHFNMIGINSLADELVMTIFKNRLDSYFSKPTFPKNFNSYSQDITKATLEVYKNVQNVLLPSPLKSHYIFNLHDLAKVIQGISLAPGQIFDQDGGAFEKLVRLWVHEVYRIFYDRLSDASDQETCFNIVKDVSHRVLHLQFSSVFKHLMKSNGVNPTSDDLHYLMFSDCLNSAADEVYDEVTDFEQAQETLEATFEEMNSDSNSSSVDLVMFRYAIEHVSRIVRVLRQPSGHCLLIGMVGSGRQSLARLATFVAGYELFKIDITKAFGFTDWRKSLRKLLRKAGEDNKQIVFLFSDQQIKVCFSLPNSLFLTFFFPKFLLFVFFFFIFRKLLVKNILLK